jgi:hypothetical protein
MRFTKFIITEVLNTTSAKSNQATWSGDKEFQ